MNTKAAAVAVKRHRTSATDRLSEAEARVLQTALDENGVRWGQYATEANLYRRDAAMRLERAGMLCRVKALFPVRSSWALTEAGREALASHQRRLGQTSQEQA